MGEFSKLALLTKLILSQSTLMESRPPRFSELLHDVGDYKILFPALYHQNKHMQRCLKGSFLKSLFLKLGLLTKLTLTRSNMMESRHLTFSELFREVAD